jgi:hypothetical protein
MAAKIDLAVTAPNAASPVKAPNWSAPCWPRAPVSSIAHREAGHFPKISNYARVPLKLALRVTPHYLRIFAPHIPTDASFLQFDLNCMAADEPVARQSAAISPNLLPKSQRSFASGFSGEATARPDRTRQEVVFLLDYCLAAITATTPDAMALAIPAGFFDYDQPSKALSW